VALYNVTAETPGFGDKPCQVTPDSVTAVEGDQVKFTNNCSCEVRFEFAAGLFEEDGLVLSPGSNDTLTVQSINENTYPYDVFCDGDDMYPDKAARPRIVVYK
jgi:hypothetical protein